MEMTTKKIKEFWKKIEDLYDNYKYQFDCDTLSNSFDTSKQNVTSSCSTIYDYDNRCISIFDQYMAQ